MLVFKPGDWNGQGTKTVGQSQESLFIWRVLFARVRIKGLQLRPMEKIPPVVSLNACMLRVSHGMKFKVAKKCLYSKGEEWLQMLSTSSFSHSMCGCSRPLETPSSQILSYRSYKMFVWDWDTFSRGNSWSNYYLQLSVSLHWWKAQGLLQGLLFLKCHGLWFKVNCHRFYFTWQHWTVHCSTAVLAREVVHTLS